MMKLPDVEPVQALKQATERNFSGGWNNLDDDLNLNPKYSKVVTNVHAGAAQAMTVRWGTRLFCSLTATFSSPGVKIVNLEYYNGAFIVVGSNGEIAKVLGDGTATIIWSTAIAATKPGAPAGWSPLTFASFAQFNGELIICNGIDKPLIVHRSFITEYLQDLATGSNLNTPICKYVTVASRYMVMAGDPVNPNRVHISARDTSGTWYGDPAPNDGTHVDVGSILANATVIRGVAAFREQLIISFTEGTIIGVLGTYDSAGTTHLPNFDDHVDQFGSVSHRNMVSYGDDMLMMDQFGVPSFKRTVLTGSLKPERVSELIDPEMTTGLEHLSFASLEDRTFSVYNQREGEFLFFIPNADTLAATTETVAYVFVYRPSLNMAGWCKFTGWNFTCGARSLQGNVFFGDASGNIWFYGNRDDPVYTDYTTVALGPEGGTPINIDWERAWTDLGKRRRRKKSKYIAVDTTGTGQFTVSMYVDRFRYNSSGVDTPFLTMPLIGADAGGFGDPAILYGSGRNTANEQHLSWPADFMLCKLRFTGAVTGPLSFVSISLLYQDGGFQR